MPYVIFDNNEGDYVRKITKIGITYTANLQEAQVYRDRSGAINAVGVVDDTLEGMSKRLRSKTYPPRNTLKVPENFDIREIEVGETGEREVKFMGGGSW